MFKTLVCTLLSRRSFFFFIIILCIVKSGCRRYTFFVTQLLWSIPVHKHTMEIIFELHNHTIFHSMRFYPLGKHSSY